MSEQPGAKVRREDLHSPPSSARSTPDPDLEALLRERSRNHFHLTFTTVEHAVPAPADDDDDETELRLFATAPNAAPQSHKIRLSSPSAGSGDLGVKKPRSYYFAAPPTSDERRQLEAAAIDATTLLELSALPWPGCALPWKVRTISALGLKQDVLLAHPPRLATVPDGARKRARKGKKTRIALRKKTQATKEKREDQARLAREKEDAEREKRTRRNREKKLKKKAKSQTKKLQGEDGAAVPATA
jgi:hypothetical protein